MYNIELFLKKSMANEKKIAIIKSNYKKEANAMATKSILKNVDIKDKKLGKSLIIALESAAGKHSKDVTLSRRYDDVRGEKIKKILGVKQ